MTMLSAADQETLRCLEQATLDQAMPAADRNRTGQFATPSLLAEDILRYAWQRWEQCPRPVHFLDPCVGTGSFFSALLRVFPRPSIKCATGYELDPAHAGTAERLWHGSGLVITQGDFLQQTVPRHRYNLLITNPPYV